ncbi:sensor histidine kinase [Neptunitalea lumnitzerae]|uniref:histidine kinase n=1 Tax=Neptunitalea lumnitzerae TaxID=2965509 RepID=A0ABQ5MGM6_9FLAO|nr:ATP-binding protein [Neptunitalea sp. Y10]GLB48571.1 hypothetical protein Y10_09390 [Neptunitalea sp. Y10]
MNFSPDSLIFGSLLLCSILLLAFIVLTKTHIKRIRENEQHKFTLQKIHHDQLIKNSIDIQEHERKRIAADIHDDLIGKLRHLQFMSTNETITNELTKCITTARNISHDLSPPLINDTNLEELLAYFLAPIENYYNISLHCSCVTDTHIATKIKLAVFRIFQEVITNIEKHAKANNIAILLKCNKRYIALVVTDDGKGLPEEHKTGLGLKNIALRASGLNAMYKFKNNTPKGTKFTLLCKLK